MIVYQDILIDKDVASDSYPKKEEYKGAVIALESKKVVVGDSEEAINKAIGANDSKEEAGEKMDEVKDTVINIVNAHSLQKVDLTKAEFTTAFNKYWKALKAFIDKKRYDALGYAADYKAPADKKVAAETDAKAEAKLDKFAKVDFKIWNDRLEMFKAHWTQLAAFQKDIEKNFNEFEFYLPEEGELGTCMVIPARYIGEALSPTFYLPVVGIKDAKF